MISKWAGRNVAVCATGPSLTLKDMELVRDAGFLVVGVNGAWELAHWIDVLYAGDERYWRHNIKRIEASGFKGKRYSRSSRAEKLYNAKYIKTKLGHDYNSGELAIEMACRNNPELIVMLGFDVSIEDGLHCHGPHVDTPNPNKERCRRWLIQFARIPKTYPDVKIVNCSRKTALKCFPVQSLESVLEGISQSAVCHDLAAAGG